MICIPEASGRAASDVAVSATRTGCCASVALTAVFAAAATAPTATAVITSLLCAAPVASGVLRCAPREERTEAPISARLDDRWPSLRLAPSMGIGTVGVAAFDASLGKSSSRGDSSAISLRSSSSGALNTS